MFDGIPCHGIEYIGFLCYSILRVVERCENILFQNGVLIIIILLLILVLAKPNIHSHVGEV